MANYKDIKKIPESNISDSGTEGTKVASGSTGQRGSTTGQFRFNTTTGKFEGYDGATFAEISPPPIVSSVDDGEVDSAAGGNQTFVITGGNFTSGDTAKFVSNTGVELTASSTTRDSATQITAVIAKNLFVNAQEPYDIKVVAAAGQTGIGLNLITVDNNPAWQTSSGSLGSILEGTAFNVTVSCTDVDGDTVTYAVQSGALPSGITLNTSSGQISGTENSGSITSDTTYNFTIRATANAKTTDRAFSIVIQNDYPPVWQTASGSLGTSNEGVAVNVSVSATDANSHTVTYAVQSGSLPGGLSLNTSTGAITGTASGVGSNTTSNFTLRATANSLTADRAFSYTVNNVTHFTGSFGSIDLSSGNLDNSTPGNYTITAGATFTATVTTYGAQGCDAPQSPNRQGGDGGSATGTYTFSNGNSYYVVIGTGGTGGGSSAYGNGGSGDVHRGSGGGYTGMFTGTSAVHGNSVIIGGGGGSGGGGSGAGDGGYGGGTSGGNGAGTNYGRGGTQSAGGSAPSASANAGGALEGGDGLAGGGGGYYGGGAGGDSGSHAPGGGGGSGYTGGVSSASMSNGVRAGHGRFVVALQ